MKGSENTPNSDNWDSPYDELPSLVDDETYGSYYNGLNEELENILSSRYLDSEEYVGEVNDSEENALLPDFPVAEESKEDERGYDDVSAVTTEGEKKKNKRNRLCNIIPTDFPKGDKIDELAISYEDIEKYKKLEKYGVECRYCGKKISIMKIYKEKDWFVCKKCAKKRIIPLADLRCDFYEHLEDFEPLKEFTFEGEKLYKCDRLGHAKPAFCYIKYFKMENCYKKVINCCYCRSYKSQENYLKKRRRAE